MANSFKTILLGAAGSGGASYFITFVGTSGDESAGHVMQDSSGNYYQATTPSAASYRGPGFAKYNKNGALIQNAQLNPTYTNQYCHNALVDGSNNTFLIGQYRRSDGLRFAVSKLNSSGVVQWQKYYNNDYTNMMNGVIDSNGNILIHGFTNKGGPSSSFVSYVCKINTSGGIVWQKYYGTTLDDRAGQIGIDSSDNVYISGYDDGERGHHCKINSSGALQWQRELGSVNLWNGIGVSSGGNQLVCGRNINGSLTTGLISLYNTSGSLQWSRKLSSGSTNFDAKTAAFDSAGNVYVSSTVYSSPYYGSIIKFNSSGTVQWQRTFGIASSVNFQSPAISIDANDDILIGSSGVVGGAGGQEIIFAKLPPDGSGTGQYGNFIYASSSYTVGSVGTGDTGGNQLFGNTSYSGTDLTDMNASSKSFSQTTYSL